METEDGHVKFIDEGLDELIERGAKIMSQKHPTLAELGLENYREWAGDPANRVVPPADVERNPTPWAPAKDDTLTRVNKREPKRFALKPMAGW